MDNVKSINALMKHMRNKHKIDIMNGGQKRKLRNIGYYHGYKGYRYIKNINNKIPYADFNENLAIYEFDMCLKALIYPQIMFIETAMKNYVLEIILLHSKSRSFSTIYNKLLTSHKDFTVGTDQYKRALKLRLNIRNSIYNSLTKAYNSDQSGVPHFYHKDMSVPIWAIFEVITFGEFGNLVSCLDKVIRQEISLELKLHQGCDTDKKLVASIIYTLKDLRNSVAHNNVIFDTRFKKSNTSNSLISCLISDTNIASITFASILDYIILISYILKRLGVSKTDINKFIRTFEEMSEDLRKQIPISTYNKINLTNSMNKLNSLKTFIKS